MGEVIFILMSTWPLVSYNQENCRHFSPENFAVHSHQGKQLCKDLQRATLSLREWTELG